MIRLSRSLQSLCRLVAALLAILSLVPSLSALGSSSWHAFPIWLFALAAFYFLITAAFTVLNLPSIPTSSPTFEGSLFVSLIISLVMLCSGAANFQLPVPALICGQILLPLCLLFICLFLSGRPSWSWSRPGKFLLLPLLYFAITLSVTAILPTSTALLFPFRFLDIANFGALRMLIALVLLGIFGLLIGYSLQLAQLLVAVRLVRGRPQPAK